MTGDGHLHGFCQADGLAAAVFGALLAAIADVAFINGIGLQLCIGQQDREAHARAEFRREENLAPAKLAHAGHIGSHTEIDENVRIGLVRRDCAAPALTEFTGHRIVGRTGKEHDGDRLIAVILQKARQPVHYAGNVDLIHGRVAHRRIRRKIGSFFDAAEHAARNAEAQNDHRFRTGENISAVILLRTALKPTHRGDPTQVCTEFFCFLFYFFCREHS